MSCIVSIAEQPLAAGRLALIYCFQTCRQNCGSAGETRPVDGPTCRWLTPRWLTPRCDCVCGVCWQWGECKLDLKSDLKVSPCVEQPLPLIPRLERRSIRNRTVLETTRSPSGKRYWQLWFILFKEHKSFVTIINATFSKTSTVPSI